MPKPARTEAGAIPSSGAHPTVRVWDGFVRLFHWALLASFVLAWLTRHSSESVHHWAGYAAGALVLLRLVWGVVGTHYARFGQFTRGPRTVLAYLAAITTGREARYLGHNPAGGAMVLLLMAAMLVTAITGWMTTTDAFWGVEWVSRAHELMANGLLLLVVVHFCGVVLASLRHRENLVRAMLTGNKRAPEPGDIAD
jgi:cytochrome b